MSTKLKKKLAEQPVDKVTPIVPNIPKDAEDLNSLWLDTGTRW